MSFFILFLCTHSLLAQDSIKNNLLIRMANESQRQKIETCLDISELDIPIDTMFYYLKKGLAISKRIGFDSIYPLQFGLSRTYFFKGETKLALRTIQKAYPYSKYNRNPRASLGQIYMLEGVFYEALNIEDSAISNYERVIELLKNDKSKKGRSILSSTMTNYANLYLKKGQHEKAIPIYLDAIEYEEASGNNLNLVVALNNLSGCYKELKFYYKAISTSKRALQEVEKSDPNKLKGGVLTSIGEIYLLTNQRDSAYNFLSKAEVELERSASKTVLKNVYQSLANYYLSIRNFDKTKEYIAKAKKELSTNPDSFVHAHLLITEGILLRDNGIYRESLLKLDSAMRIALNNDFLIIQKNVLTEKITLFSLSKKPKQQLDAHNKLQEVNEAIFDKENIRAIAVAEVKYLTEKKEKENLQLKADNEKQAYREKILGGGIGALLLLLGLGTFFYKKNHKQKDKIVALQKELHHRVDNNLAIIGEFIDKSMENINDKKTLENLAELQSRVGSINEVHALLYQENDVTAVNIHNYISALSDQIKEIYDKKDVVINIDCNTSLTIDTARSVHFGLMVNEFLTNSFKYAFEGINNPIIDIHLKKMEDNLELSMKDNGIGFNKNEIASSSYGTRIMELLAKKLKASYSLSGIDGTILNLQLRLNQ